MEQLDYIQAEDGEAPEAPRELAPLEPAKPLIMKKGKERHADLVNPPIPEGVHPYTPGEGYGSNAIPFAGVSPKTSKRRNPGNRMKTIEMLKKAKEIADKKKELFMTFDSSVQRHMRSKWLGPPADALNLAQFVTAHHACPRHLCR